MDRDEPIWITGVGAATPLGCGLAEIESNLLAGRSGVSRVTRFPTDDYPSRIAAQLGERFIGGFRDANVVARVGEQRPQGFRLRSAVLRHQKASTRSRTGHCVVPSTRVSRR